jgi:hypothetical protein
MTEMNVEKMKTLEKLIEGIIDPRFFGAVYANGEFIDSMDIKSATEAIATAVREWHKAGIEKVENERYCSPCGGCKEGHPSFWKTVIESPQWSWWQAEQSERLHLLCEQKLPKNINVYDMPEVEECGWISPMHFKDFMQFIIQYPARN